MNEPGLAIDFGPINRDEVALLDVLAAVLRPDELSGCGYTLGVVDGTRVWQYADHGMTVTLTGDVIGSTTSSTCVVPVRGLEQIFHVANVVPDAHFVVQDGWLNVGISDDLLATRVGEGSPIVAPFKVATTEGRISAPALRILLATAVTYPIHEGDRPRKWPIGELVARRNHLECRVAWSVAGGRDVVSRVPATFPDGDRSFTSQLWHLHRAMAILDALIDFPEKSYRGDWSIDFDDSGDGSMRLAIENLEVVVPRCPSPDRQLLDDVAISLESSFGTTVSFHERSTIEAQVDGETIVGHVFDGPSGQVRISVPVCDVESAFVLPTLAEINGYNESRHATTAFMDGATVLVRSSVLDSSGLADSVPSMVRGLVSEAKRLRESIELARSIGGNRA